jgi:hypothetical protein
MAGFSQCNSSLIPCSPNLSLSLSNFNQGNWNSLLNYNTSQLDLFFGADLALAGLDVTSLAIGSGTRDAMNGVYNAASCGSTNPPSWCSGSDLGAWVNAAIAACSGLCEVHIPAGVYSYKTTITVPNIATSITGDGSRATRLFYNGSGDAMVIHPSTYTVTEAGVFRGFDIEGNSRATSAIHIIDTNQAKFYDVTARNFNGTSGNEGSGFWLDDQTENFTYPGCPVAPCPAWSERNSFINAFSYNNYKGWRFTVNGGTGSFGRFTCIACFANIEAGQFGMSAEYFSGSTGGASIYNAIIDFSGNIDGTGGTVFKIDGYSQFWDSVYHVQFENNGTSGASYLLDIAAQVRGTQGGLFDGNGKMICTACANSISPRGHYLMTGDHDALQADFQFGIGPWLIPQTVNSLEGIGFNARWDGKNWQTNGDNSHNGGALIADNNANGDVEFYSLPSTGGANQGLTQSQLSAGLMATLNGTGLVMNKNAIAPGVVTISGGATNLPSASASAGLMFTVTDSTAITAEGQTCVHTATRPATALAWSNGTVWKCF